ncbi:MAG: carboxylesterase family protein [Chitinophagaceae bacterium]|nr:carboxylesterase family protein [Chitinophagaceae bacterium]
MKRMIVLLSLTVYTSILMGQTKNSNITLQVKIKDGTLEGVNSSGIKIFKGLPFAQPPVGDLRWREPQPVKAWSGIRKADHFGPRAMQLPLFSDMNFRSDGVSEDCLYLNVWTPAKKAEDKLPVLVYFYGGGLMAGDGSEYRYDGESMARRGIITVTVNYRLSVFGFFSHPELTKESPNKASGNYGFLDQAAALKWVQQNISAFGGDPKKITIAGESAGSFSVSAQMASPLSRDIIAGAIGESGSLLGTRPILTLAEAEQQGKQFADSLGVKTLAELRKLTAQQVLDATKKFRLGSAVIDGYFFPKSPVDIFLNKQQSKVPLMVGWNSEEGNWKSILGKEEPTKENYTKAVQQLYGTKAAEVLKVYNPANDDEVKAVATDLASDRFIGFSTWRWSDIHTKTGAGKVYRYYYERPRPATRENPDATAATGAVHSAEIEYAMGNLGTNRVFNWQPDDFLVSQVLQSYFEYFIKTGNPNGLGVPEWNNLVAGKPAEVMHINVDTRMQTEKYRDRYLMTEKL